MKKMIKILRYLGKLLAVIVIVSSMSCEDDDNFSEVAINNVESANFYPGDLVTFQGSNFDEVLFVFLGNNQIPFQLDGDLLTFTLPESAAIGDALITLVMPDGYIVTSNIQVVARPFPIITAITPSAAPEGGQVTIIGTSLDNLQSVTIGEIEANVVSSSATELVITVPSGLEENLPASVKVLTTGGEATPASIFFVGENLIVNGELELGDGDEFTNWGKWNGGDGLTATTADGEAYSGRSLRALGVGGDAWRTQFVSDPVPTQVGVEYTLIVQIKGQAGTPGVGGNIRFSTNPDALYSGNYDITSEWQQIQWAFVANADQTRAVLDLGVIANAIYHIDNITMIATGLSGPQPTEILLNGGFEEGDGDEFTNWNKFNGADLLTATTESGEVRSGSRALRAVGFGGDAWRTQLASDVVETEDGVEYTASLWIKAAPGPGNGGAIRMSTTGNGDAQYQGNVSITTEWQKVEWLFTANSTQTGLVLDLGATENAVYFIDDVSLLAPPNE